MTAIGTAPAPSKRNTSVHTVEIPRRTLDALAGKFPEGVTVLLAAPDDLASEWVRLPKQGELCSVTQLPRTTLIEVLKRAGSKVKVRTLREKGATTGITLIDRASLNAYIEDQPPPDWMPNQEEETKPL